MKILFVSTDDYPHIGGKSTHMECLVEGLKKQNIESEIFARNNIDNLSLFIGKIILQPLKLFSKKMYIYKRKKMELLMFYIKLKKFLKKNSYDLISAQDANSATIVGKINSQIPLVLTMHTYFGLEYTLDNNFFNLEDKFYKRLVEYEENCLNYVTSIVAVDERIKQHISKKILSLNSTRNLEVKKISNFTNTDNFYPASSKKNQLLKNLNLDNDDFVILCVRRLVEKNGVIYAVKAIKELENEKRVKLIILGDGPEKDSISKFIIENNLDEQVHLVGAINNNQLLEWYSIADCVVVPSITVNGLQEATSISALESMSCGKVTIASSIGGIKELIEDNQTGILVSEKSPIAIKEAIIDLLNNPEKINYLGTNARNHIELNHSHISVAKQYFKIFEKAMNLKK